MVKIVRGNLLKADVEALVNTVNCDGYMGKGIALQFKQAFPSNYEQYRIACNHGEMTPGKVFVHETGEAINPKLIINFPTKRHWREKSRIGDIESGLNTLISEIQKRGIKSIALPPLGCGLGGLSWKVVRPKIEKAFRNISGVRVFLYEPGNPPDAKTMPVRTKRPHLTFLRAILIKLMNKYTELAYSLSLLEVQKMAYFMQESGEPMRLKYEAGKYGPYAKNLNKVLQLLEGHFIRGLGDSDYPEREIIILEGAIEETNNYLASCSSEHKRKLEKIESLIEGFETPYGMELLSSVHWVATNDPLPAKDENEAASKIRNWNKRKAEMFNPKHVQIAWNRLKEHGWLSKYPAR